MARSWRALKPFNVYLDSPALGNPLVVIGQDRTLTAVPEPSSATLAAWPP